MRSFVINAEVRGDIVAHVFVLGQLFEFATFEVADELPETYLDAIAATTGAWRNLLAPST